jgi:hypothetical protein
MKWSRVSLITLIWLGGASMSFAQLGITPPPGTGQPQNPIGDIAKPPAVGPAQADTAAQTPGAGPAPETEHQVTGATAQTMPAKYSAENAEQDQRPIVSFAFPLSPEQKRAIYDAVARTQSARLADTEAKVGNLVPATAAVSEFPSSITASIPQADNYRYALAGDRVLLINPREHSVVGEISN